MGCCTSGRLISGVSYQFLWYRITTKCKLCLLMWEQNVFVGFLGNLLDSINYYGPGSVSAFSNGDLFVNTNSFKGRIQINGSVVWQTSDSLLTMIQILLHSGMIHCISESMTGLSFTSIPFTQNGDNKALLMKDGGWIVLITQLLFNDLTQTDNWNGRNPLHWLILEFN